MTDIQIHYFLTAARCLNFTEAAKQLYISQPALSQQISALERELNMQLFVRMKGRLYLTPPAIILMEELPQYQQHYMDIIEKAKIAYHGITNTLKLGILEGQTLQPDYLKNFFAFREKYPNVEIKVYSFSLDEEVISLLENKVDIICVPDFEVKNKNNVLYLNVSRISAIAMMSVYHPLADQKITSLKQLRYETFLMLRETGSLTLNSLIMNDFKNAGIAPNIRYVASLNENILCTELGMGIGISNSDNYAVYNPNIKILKDLDIADQNYVHAWKKDNMNPAIPLFVHSFPVI